MVNSGPGTASRSSVSFGDTAPDEQEVMLETLGGQIGDLGMRVEARAPFTVGERVIVFMHDGGPYTAFRPVGMGQGVLRVRTEQGVETVTRTARA